MISRGAQAAPLADGNPCALGRLEQCCLRLIKALQSDEQVCAAQRIAAAFFLAAQERIAMEWQREPLAASVWVAQPAVVADQHDIEHRTKAAGAQFAHGGRWRVVRQESIALLFDSRQQFFEPEVDRLRRRLQELDGLAIDRRAHLLRLALQLPRPDPRKDAEWHQEGAHREQVAADRSLRGHRKGARGTPTGSEDATARGLGGNRPQAS
jgi:hypothetical protein